MQQAVMPRHSDDGNKLIGLEVLRFLAAFAILIYHYRHLAFVADKPVDLVPERLPFYWLLWPIQDSGAFGVWVFWCISGFIFFWKYRDPIADGAVSGGRFFVLRFSRLYPLHLVTLLAVALLQTVYFKLRGCFFVYQFNDPLHFLAQLFMASEWSIVQGDGFNGPIWSVSVEVLVYFLFYLMLRATRSWVLNVVVVFVCIDVAFVAATSQLTNCLALFYAGGLSAIARRAIATSRFKIAAETIAWFAAVAIPVLLGIFASDQLDRYDLPIFVGYVPILLFCLSRKIALPPVVQSALEAVGNMTYSSYLLHFPLQLTFVLCFCLLYTSPSPRD